MYSENIKTGGKNVLEMNQQLEQFRQKNWRGFYFDTVFQKGGRDK